MQVTQLHFAVLIQLRIIYYLSTAVVKVESKKIITNFEYASHTTTFCSFKLSNSNFLSNITISISKYS